MKITRVPVGHLETNCWVVVGERDRAVVIDPGDDAEVIFSVLGSARVEAVILTHGHFDHVGAVDEVADDMGAFVWAHTDEVKFLKNEYGTGGREFGLETPVPKMDLTATDGGVIEVEDMKFEVMHTPGHTPGSICLLLQDTVTGERHLFTGDTLFARSIGRTDFFGGDDEAMDESLARIAALPFDTHVYPGHGPATTLQAESMTNPYWPSK